jgi:SagB-type dehydrogenase family enzyme
MTMNEAVQAVLDYHRATNHSVESVQSNNLALDFSNLPRTYKLYRKLETVPLPEEPVASTLPALNALSTTAGSTEESVPDLATLSTLLKLSAGITKWLTVPNGKMAFRAASCTGAMYHIELYVVCAELEGLPAGVYQYGVHDNALRRIRSSDFRGALTDTTGNHSGVANAPVTIVYTSVFWRNAWKYQGRAYRHAYWDGGTILANTLALASSHGLPASVVTGFVDDAVNRLVDVDGAKEAALFMVPIGYTPSRQKTGDPAPERARLETLPYSPQEVNYPLIRSTHDATSLADADAVRSWRSSAMSVGVGPSTSQLTSLSPAKADEQPQASVDEVIQQRGSTRRFQETPISYADFSTMLSAATAGVPGDYLSESSADLNDVYLIVNAVEGLVGGTYVYHRNSQELELLQEGQFREEAGHLGLGQPLAHDAAVNVYFMADLDKVTSGLGPRGYRAAQLDASTTAGRLYLSAYALGLGASGLTFFDDEVTEFFAPHSKGKSVMFLVLLGAPAYRKKVDRDRTWFNPETPK